MPLAAFALHSLFHASIIPLLVLGFGFVIFFHELGHFLAAKWVGIKVEQFAVGFGHAIFSWRKGIGFRLGNTQKEYQRRLDDYVLKHHDDLQHRDKNSDAYQAALIDAEKALKLGETEYRLNWIPLGGYVKMLGQDDLRPNATANDPRSYNRKSIAARMVVVSAGVIMNVILAGIGFMILFMWGFHVPPPLVGSVSDNSPAQNAIKLVNGKPIHAPLLPGDRIIDYYGSPQQDFTKIGLNVALSPDGVAQPVKVRRLSGAEEQVLITPKADENSGGFLSIGIGQPVALRGPDPADVDQAEWDKEKKLSSADANVIDPGDQITQVNGHNVAPDEFWKLSQALQDPLGNPVSLTIRKFKTGQEVQAQIRPHYDSPFGSEPLSFAGMVPRAVMTSIVPGSPAEGKVQPGDIVISVGIANDRHKNPSTQQLKDILKQAGESGQMVNLIVLRDGKEHPLDSIPATARIESGKGPKTRGLGVGLSYDDLHPLVAETVKDSPAYVAGIPTGALITAIAGNKVSNWFDVQRCLGQAKENAPLQIDFTTDAGPASKEITLNADQLFQISQLRRVSYLGLRELEDPPRKASNPAQAAWWGVTETRDFILQFYLTLRRMVGGSVSPGQLMGPLGIVTSGAKIASKGYDWLVWFLAMISANLAVVNFLPIPIVDGGLFTFLILEKIQGRPLSPRAQAIAQYVGLAFLAGVFIFVTYHDILRIW